MFTPIQNRSVAELNADLRRAQLAAANDRMDSHNRSAFRRVARSIQAELRARAA